MQKFNTNMLLGLLVLILIISVIVLSPFALVWAWNTLFLKFHFIEYNFENWVAVSIFMWAFGLLKLDFTKSSNSKY